MLVKLLYLIRYNNWQISLRVVKISLDFSYLLFFCRCLLLIKLIDQIIIRTYILMSKVKLKKKKNGNKFKFAYFTFARKYYLIKININVNIIAFNNTQGKMYVLVDLLVCIIYYENYVFYIDR